MFKYIAFCFLFFASLHGTFSPEIEHKYYAGMTEIFAKTVRQFPFVNTCECQLEISEQFHKAESCLIQLKMEEGFDWQKFQQDIRESAAKFFQLEPEDIEVVIE